MAPHAFRNCRFAPPVVLMVGCVQRQLRFLVEVGLQPVESLDVDDFALFVPRASPSRRLYELCPRDGRLLKRRRMGRNNDRFGGSKVVPFPASRVCPSVFEEVWYAATLILGRAQLRVIPRDEPVLGDSSVRWLRSGIALRRGRGPRGIEQSPLLVRHRSMSPIVGNNPGGD